MSKQDIRGSKKHFIDPYAPSKRNFQMYFLKKGLDTSHLQSNSNNPELLDGISRTDTVHLLDSDLSPIPKRSNALQNKSKTSHRNKSTNPTAIPQNSSNDLSTTNNQIFSMLSKHIVPKSQTPRKVTAKNRNESFNEIQGRDSSYKRLNSMRELQRNPKITEFQRVTFYQNNIKRSQTMKKQLAKKLKEDNMHFMAPESQERKTLYRKTKENISKGSFTSYQIYNVSGRIGISAQVNYGLTGKQIKFRLILNQLDTEIFNKNWRSRVQDFISTCVKVDEEHGITLKVGRFLEHSKKYLSDKQKEKKKIYLGKSFNNVKEDISQSSRIFKVGGKKISQNYFDHKHRETEAQSKKQQPLATQVEKIQQSQGQIQKDVVKEKKSRGIQFCEQSDQINDKPKQRSQEVEQQGEFYATKSQKEGDTNQLYRQEVEKNGKTQNCSKQQNLDKELQADQKELNNGNSDPSKCQGQHTQVHKVLQNDSN